MRELRVVPLLPLIEKNPMPITPLTPETAQAALEKVDAPELGRPITDGFVKDLAVEGDAVSLSLTPPTHFNQGLEAAVREALAAAGAKSVKIAWEIAVTTRNILPDDPCPSVRNILLVMSGKGGVGKSTVATNLTLALNRAGARVGLLDADMYGPSIPTMLGVMGRPTSTDGQKFLPLERFGVKLMSIGFLLEDPRAAVVWRFQTVSTPGNTVRGSGGVSVVTIHCTVAMSAWGPSISSLPPARKRVASSGSGRVTTVGAWRTMASGFVSPPRGSLPNRASSASASAMRACRVGLLASGRARAC